MLTKHNYSSSTKKIEDPNDSIFKCCNQNVTDEPICTDPCYDTWVEELKMVTKKVAEAEECYTQARKMLDFTTSKKDRLKKWIDELDKAEDGARKICNQLEIIAGQSEKIWYNSIKSVESIKILFCMIKGFYLEIDRIQLRYEALEICIKQNNNSALEPGVGLLKFIAEYGKKLADVIKTRDAIIKATVNAIRLSNLIRNNISTKECSENYNPCSKESSPSCIKVNPPGIPAYYGFKTIVCEWFFAFECDKKCEDNKPDCVDDFQTKDHSKDTDPSLHLCGNKCELEPMFEFPFCNNSYKTKLNKGFEDAIVKAKKAEEKVKTARATKEAMVACMQSLEKAIKAVDPKGRCN
jgi:hypothetical protein